MKETGGEVKNEIVVYQRNETVWLDVRLENEFFVQEEIVAKVSAIRDKAKSLKADTAASLAAAKKQIEEKIIGREVVHE